MNTTKTEECSFEQAIAEATVNLVALSDAQLALIGGGIGDVIVG
jgi:hypothetical protein